MGLLGHRLLNLSLRHGSRDMASISTDWPGPEPRRDGADLPWPARSLVDLGYRNDIVHRAAIDEGRRVGLEEARVVSAANNRVLEHDEIRLGDREHLFQAGALG